MGVTTCVSGAFQQICTAGMPAATDTCDGIDNDCDGVVDDNVAPTCAGQTLQEISTIVSNYLLTPEQEAALIGYSSGVSNIQVSGSTTDRLGRTGIVFSATDRAPGEYEDRLIISPRTGQILGAETLYTGTSRTDLHAPAVVDYTAWER